MQVWSAVIFANLVWGLAPILAKTGLQGLNEIDFLLLRFFLSSVFLSPWVVSSMRRIRGLTLPQIALGVLAVSANYYLQVFALKQAPVTWYVFFYSLCPILSLFVVRVQLSRRLIVGAGAACLGSWIFADLQGENISFATMAALILSVISWVLFTLSIQSWQKVLDDAEISAAVSFLSLVVFVAIAACGGSWSIEAWTAHSFWATAVLALMLPAAFFAYSYALRNQAGLAVVGQYAEPIFGTLGGVLILHEALSTRQVTGLLVVIFALAVTRS